MLSLADAQTNFIRTINDGPNQLDPMLFAGPLDRILLGLKAHANTISHARIIALEQSFPLTRTHMGDIAFNKIAREFIETDLARSSNVNCAGLGFPDYLRDTATRELACVEWAWLESYHAAEAAAMTAADLAGLDEADLLAVRVAAHPSARTVNITCPIASTLHNLADKQPAAIMCTRPVSEVRIIPLGLVEATVFDALAGKSMTLRNLLTIAIEQAREKAPIEPLLFLIGAGALVKAG